MTAITKEYQFCDKCNRTFPMNHWGCLYCGGKLRVFEVECEPQKRVVEPLSECIGPVPLTVGHLIFCNLEREWFFINGDRSMRFKTRGNNFRDLRSALIRYGLEFWETDFDLCVRDMASQLNWQARKKTEPLVLEAIK